MALPLSQQTSLPNKNSRRSTGVGRNEPCPCSSGKKYKKCCLAKHERQRREESEYHARWNTEIWYPKASDLELPDMPETLREDARKVLGRALPRLFFERGIAIQAQRCWLIAQALTAVASGDLGYVEGVWTRAPGNQLYFPKEDTEAENFAAHAWNSFRGHIIDLPAEFFNWRSSREDSPWFHEPLKEYPLEELRKLEWLFDEDISAGDDYGNISPWVLIPQESLPVHLRNEPDYHASGEFDRQLFHRFWNEKNEYLDQVAFEPARERLLARINGTIGRAA